MKLGKRCGFLTLLVLSGVTHLEGLKTAEGAMPDYYADQLSDILHLPTLC